MIKPVKVLAALLLLIAAFIVVKNTSLKTKAVSPTVSVILSPTQIQIDSGTNKIAYVHLVLTYNPVNVQLTNITPTSLFKNVISITPLTTANLTGVMDIFLGLDPADVATAPSGQFTLATTSWTVSTSGSVIVDSSSQIVTLDDLPATISALPLKLTPTLTPPGQQGLPCDGSEGVYLYQNIYFSGRCSRFITSVPTLVGTTVGNDSVSSVKIIGRYKAVLYRNTNYTGRNSIFALSVAVIKGQAVGNDATSSVIVKPF